MLSFTKYPYMPFAKGHVIIVQQEVIVGCCEVRFEFNSNLCRWQSVACCMKETSRMDGRVDSIHRSGSLCSRSLCSLSLAIFSQVFGFTSLQGASAGSIEYNVKINAFVPFSTRMWVQGNCLLSCVLKDRLKVKFALA